MKLERFTVLKSGLSGVAIALALLLATSGCSDSSNDGAGDSSMTASEPEVEKAPEVESAPEAERAPEAIGELVIDGQSYTLTKAHWCEPEEGFESGTTVAIRVAAQDESGDVTVYGIQVDRDEGASSTSRISVATDPSTNYKSEGLDREPAIVIEDGAVRLRGGVYRSGRDPEVVVVEAEFSLPPEPGFPGQC
jgi:hypothetical protein